jgi:hypothetical protein
MLLWAQTLAGLWVVVSPWILGFSDVGPAKWSSVLVGLLIFLSGAWSIYFKNKNL